MDRLFLTGLVREHRDSVIGCVVRSASFDSQASLVIFETSLPRPGALVVSLEREVAGFYRGEAPRRLRPVASLKKWLTGSRVVDFGISEVDRVVTLSLEQTRLSGRKIRLEVVLEVAGSRVALYVVDAESRTVIEAFARGPKRLEPGQSYVSCPPPPQASPLAESVAEFEKRLATSSKDALLSASGLTPLLVSELRWLMERQGLDASGAFASLIERLRQPSPMMYVSDDTILLSPISLESRSNTFVGRPFGTFNQALAEAVGLANTRRRFENRYRRLASAVERSLAKTRRLRDKLIEQRKGAEAASENRRFGEQLLAGLSQARRVRAEAVSVPDSFDPDGGEIEIEIDPRRSLASNAERYFAMARRAERAARVLDERIRELGQFIGYLEETEVALADVKGEEEIEQLELETIEEGLVFPAGKSTPPARRAEGTRLSPRSFTTGHGGTILVGRSSRGNEALTFRIARPNDLWFHVANMPGAHVVLRAASVGPADEEVEQAASVAAYYSKARQDSRVEVIVTERRNVSKLKGAPPGTVAVKRYRTLRVSPKIDVETA
ncbi:MAG TPA: NFACT RNA binding domain-containing protein [Vicinamibacteria bacterium]|nr:NFACT RNA binding domain-containing protein [Vicinamibacteria bacterium]